MTPGRRWVLLLGLLGSASGTYPGRASTLGRTTSPRLRDAGCVDVCAAEFRTLCRAVCTLGVSEAPQSGADLGHGEISSLDCRKLCRCVPVEEAEECRRLQRVRLAGEGCPCGAFEASSDRLGVLDRLGPGGENRPSTPKTYPEEQTGLNLVLGAGEDDMERVLRFLSIERVWRSRLFEDPRVEVSGLARTRERRPPSESLDLDSQIDGRDNLGVGGSLLDILDADLPVGENLLEDAAGNGIVPPEPPGNDNGVNWEMWCMVQCGSGNGGSACNCDIIP
ncbi:uncharacterized protein LOC105698681 isoform X2 [Orussus abietinus]|nr:uncharacterized protein LOC105698681 isoform X2 [Orussus abietinus]